MLHPLLDKEPGIVKLCQFPAVDEHGNQLLEVFHHPDQLHHSYMDKVAAPFLPQVREYIDNLKPDPNSIYSLVNALGAYEYWSCFPDGSPVSTERGRVPIEGVVAGDKVLTHRNRWRTVTGTKRVQADWELVGLHVRGLPQIEPFIEATPLHEFWVVSREEMIQKRREFFYYKKGSRDERRRAFVKELEFDWVPIGELRAGDYIAQPFPVEEDSSLQAEWGSPEVAALAGLYAAEGCTADRYDLDMLPDTDPTSFVIFVLGDHEERTVDRIRECAEKFGHTPYVVHDPDTHSYRVQLSWADFARFCRDHIGCGATNKFLSNEILRMPREWQETFFDFYHRGDGCIRGERKGHGTFRATTASLQLALDARLLLARLGYLSSVNGRHNKKSTWYNGNPIYELCIGGSQFQGDIENVSGYLHPDGFILSPIKSVTSREFKGWVSDLQVEEDSSFTVSGVSVHNSNINGDGFEEEMLIHRGPVWGYETFLHYARPYMHHANKGPDARAFGSVELACWHDHMKRVELVVRLDREDAEKVGAHNVIDKIDQGQLPDTSMGCKVPYDLCSITTDWDLYRKALSGYDPRTDRHPGMAVLRYHKSMRPIPGVSITRNDYSEYLKYRMNEILPDGRKVFAFNPYPRFFDISFVFIGADKTSKMMAKLASRAYVVVPSSYVAESYGYSSSTDQPSTHKEFEKAASVEGARAMLRSFKKRASQRKRAEITKEIVPSQFGSKAVPILEDSEKELPKDTLDRMGGCSLSQALSTPTMLGITLKPREFQRITLCRMGRKGLADELDDDGKVFGPSDDVDRSIPMGSEFISSLIGKMLRGAIEERSALGPPLKRRMIRITIIGKPKSEEPDLEESKDDLLDKVSAAYNGYREQMIEKIADISRQLCRYPELQAAVYGKDEADIFYGLTKESAGVDPSLLLGATTGTYLLSSLARHRMQKKGLRGEQTGLLTRVLAEHPYLATTAAGVAVLKAGGSDLPDKVLKGAITAGKRLISAG